MTIAELRKIVEAWPRDAEQDKVQVWLPGSRIDLCGKLFKSKAGTVLLEGNIEPGSALDS